MIKVPTLILLIFIVLLFTGAIAILILNNDKAKNIKKEKDKYFDDEII